MRNIQSYTNPSVAMPPNPEGGTRLDASTREPPRASARGGLIPDRRLKSWS